MKLFLFKIMNSDDRDVVAYVDLADLENKHFDIANHINIHGAAYSSDLRITDDGKFYKGYIAYCDEFVEYSDIKTVLTEEELITLANPVGKNLEPIIEKLKSTENKTLFNEVQQEEIDFIYDEYSIDAEEVEELWDTYSNYGYRDRGLIAGIFKDAYECGYEEAWSLGYVNNNSDDIVSRYFDFESFGEDLTEEEQYYELSDGRIVCINL